MARTPMVRVGQICYCAVSEGVPRRSLVVALIVGTVLNLINQGDAMLSGMPAARGGTDQGPTPIETMIASLLGCTNVILNRVAEKNHVEVRALSLAAEASFDRHGVLLEEEVAVPFPEIRLTINLTTPSTDLQVERVKADLGKFCPVSRVIRQSGTRLEEIWNVTRT